MLQSALPLQPKNANGILKVVIIGRISTEHQNIENIEASYRYVENYLQQIYQGPVEIKLLGEQASGMLTSRASIQEAEQLVAAGEVDLVISEDLSRIYRNPRHQYDFVQNAVDVGTRVICIGDHLDTADENWEVMMGAAALRHGLFIPDTRRRVRRTATNSFHQGGMVAKVRFGYRKLTKDEAASGQFGPKGLRLAKLPECTPPIRFMRNRFLAGASYAAIADRLDVDGVETGPFAPSGHWTGKLVETLFRDPILSGTRTFRKTIYEQIFRTGEHRRRRNGAPETQVIPELAHLTREEQEEMWRAMDERAASCGAMTNRGQKRMNVPRSRSFWPGQAAICGICGGMMYYRGVYLSCKNSRPGAGKPCWNHVQVHVELARKRVLAWLLSYCQPVPPLREALIALAWEHWRRLHCHAPKAKSRSESEIALLEQQAANLAKAIAMGGELDALLQQSKTVHEAIQVAQERLANEVSAAVDSVPPLSKEEIESRFDQILLDLANTSFEFADDLRRLFPKFVVCPLQALDTPLIRPEGRLLFRPSGLGVDSEECLTHRATEIEVVLDLFEPPEHIRHLAACVAAKQSNPRLSLKKVAAGLGIGHMTVKRALAYAQLMECEGLTVPYRTLLRRPEQGSRWNKRRMAS